MSVTLHNPDPDDPIAKEAASIARDILKAYLVGERDFLRLATREAQAFAMLERETDPHEVVDVGAVLVEHFGRTVRVIASMAALAALAVDMILPEDDEVERDRRITAFFEQASEYTY